MEKYTLTPPWKKVRRCVKPGTLWKIQFGIIQFGKIEFDTSIPLALQSGKSDKGSGEEKCKTQKEPK